MKNPLLSYLSTPIPTSFQDTKTFGWGRGLCFQYDREHANLWETWLDIVVKGSWSEGEPVPYVTLQPYGQQDIYKQLQRCYDVIANEGYRLHEFIHWIGYSIGIAWCSQPSTLPERLQEYLFKSFPFEQLIKYPSDYFGRFLAENGASGQLDYYPTPLQITIAMNEMVGPTWDDSVLEPCLGPGGMVLPTKSLNIVGMDLNPLMVRAACIQAFFYKPQLLFSPIPIVGIHVHPIERRVHKYFEFNTNTRIYWGNSLLGEYQAPTDIFRQDSEMVDVYVHPLQLSKREIYQYLDLLNKDWNSLSKEQRFTLVKVMSREHKFDVVLTNPPFNAKLSKAEREEMEKIYRENEDFLSKINHNVAHIKNLEKEAQEKVYEQLTLF